MRDEIEQALADLVRVFKTLDWNAFKACLADDVTVYSPFPGLPRLTIGKVALERGWRPMFELGRARLPGPPYLNLEPREVHHQPLDAGAWLVTFYLEGLLDTTLHRRTIVFQKRGDRWLIVHLHASAVSESK